MIPGSFDPVTKGHLDIIERAVHLFDRVIVVAMINEKKEYRFSSSERVAFIQDAVKHLENVQVDFFDGMLYDYVIRRQACAIVKGIRDAKDTDYELWMADYNKEHAPGCETVFLPAKKGLEQISSTEVKRRIAAGEDISALVTPMVASALINE